MSIFTKLKHSIKSISSVFVPNELAKTIADHINQHPDKWAYYDLNARAYTSLLIPKRLHASGFNKFPGRYTIAGDYGEVWIANGFWFIGLYTDDVGNRVSVPFNLAGKWVLYRAIKRNRTKFGVVTIDQIFHDPESVIAAYPDSVLARDAKRRQEYRARS